MQCIRRELPPSCRLWCGGVSLRFSASPTISPTPQPLLRGGRPSGGFRAPGGSAAACEGARDLPSLPPFINGKPEKPALPGWGGWWQPPWGLWAAEAREIAFPCSVPGLWLPPLVARGACAHPWPSACMLGPWAAYGGGRAEPRLRGARVWAAAWRLPARGPGAPEPAWCDRPRPAGHRGRGRGPGSGARLHPWGVWIVPVRGGHREAGALQEAQPPRAGVQGS